MDDISILSEDELNTEIEKGYADMMAKREMPIDDAFQIIKKLRHDYSSFEKFGEVMPDGRLTEVSNGKTYRLREAISLSKQLGRTLTAEEMTQFVL